MRFSTIFTPLLALASTGTLAAPSAPEARALLPIAPQLSPATANSMVVELYSKIEPMMASINRTVSGINSKSSASQKAAAIKAVGQQMSLITNAINTAAGNIGLKARGTHFKRDASPEPVAEAAPDALAAANANGNPLNQLANNLAKLLTNLAGTVNTALAVLGLTGLLAFLTPLTGSLSGIVLQLITVVNPLLDVLKILLDGVLVGLSGLLAGLIL